MADQQREQSSEQEQGSEGGSRDSGKQQPQDPSGSGSEQGGQGRRHGGDPRTESGHRSDSNRAGNQPNISNESGYQKRIS